MGVAHYPYISKPDTQAVEKGWAQSPMYKVNLSIPTEEAQPIIEQINAVLLAGMKAEKEKNPKKKIKQAPLPYSNELDEDDTETGNVVFKFKSKFKPSVFDAKNKPMVDHNIYGGSELRVGGMVSYYNSPSVGCGVTLRLGGVQVISYVEGTSGADSFGFEEEEGFSDSSAAASEESIDTQEDVQLNIVETPAEVKPKAVAKPKPKAVPKPAPVEEPAPATAVSSQDELANEIAKLVKDVTDD